MRYFKVFSNQSFCNIFVFTTSLHLLLIGCSELSNEQSQSIPKPEIENKYEMEEIPMIIMDTFLSFDKMTYEEEVKVVSTKVNSRDFIKQVFGTAPSNNTIDSILRKNLAQNTTDLIIIDHQQQKAYQILNYIRSKDH
jgi:hypothetical protein